MVNKVSPSIVVGHSQRKRELRVCEIHHLLIFTGINGGYSQLRKKIGQGVSLSVCVYARRPLSLGLYHRKRQFSPIVVHDAECGDNDNGDRGFALLLHNVVKKCRQPQQIQRNYHGPSVKTDNYQ